jgi:starvation-inducible DNA-binding protein
MIKITTLVNQYVADAMLFIVKLHNLHWNTVGRHFDEIHKYTEVLYNRFFEVYDEFAEALKSRDEIVFGSMADYLRMSSLKEVTQTRFTDSEALLIIQNDLEMLLLTANKLRELSKQEDDYTILLLAQEEVAYIQKELWMLKATLS